MNLAIQGLTWGPQAPAWLLLPPLFQKQQHPESLGQNGMAGGLVNLLAMCQWGDSCCLCGSNREGKPWGCHQGGLHNGRWGRKGACVAHMAVVRRVGGLHCFRGMGAALGGGSEKPVQPPWYAAHSRPRAYDLCRVPPLVAVKLDGPDLSGIVTWI